jgi:hypothetical protein
MQYLPCMADNLTSPGAPLRSRVPAFPAATVTAYEASHLCRSWWRSRRAAWRSPLAEMAVSKRASLVPAMISERIGFEIMRLNGTMYGAQNP